MSIIMEASSKFLPDLALGNVVRYGAILKDAGTGQIVGHLKEAGVMGNILSSFTQSPFGALNVLNPLGMAADVVGHAVNGYQLYGVQRSVDEVKALVEGLQLATNVAAIASVASLGISVAGFAMVQSKLKQMDSKLDGIAGDVQSIKRALTEMSLNWDALSDARFDAATETLIVAEKASTEMRKREHAQHAVHEFSLLRQYYSKLLQRRSILEDPELNVAGLNELMARYTVSCMGLLQGEFMTGDLSAYRGWLDLIQQEYAERVCFSAREVYLARCDKAAPLELELNHEVLSSDLTTLAAISNESVARLESCHAELAYLEVNNIAPARYLEELREHETDIVLLKHSY
jgi:hypothetical protein